MALQNKSTSSFGRKASGQSSRDTDINAVVSEMTCACSRSGLHSDAPIAKALFDRVEVMNQSPRHAAQAMGLEAGDAAYLLAGFREDLAKDLVFAMLAERPAIGPGDHGDIDEE